MAGSREAAASAVEKRKKRPKRERKKEETKKKHRNENRAKEHISRFELAVKTDRRVEFRVPSIQHLRSLYSSSLASLTYNTPHTEPAEKKRPTPAKNNNHDNNTRTICVI